MLDTLSVDERIQLVRFVCSFAWADLEIREEERTYVANLVRRLGLGDAEQATAEEMLKEPPAPETIDPLTIPVKHRQIFLDSVLGMIAADGEIAEGEALSYNLLQQLVR